MKLFTEKDFKLQDDYITCSVYEAANIANQKVAPLLEQCFKMKEALEFYSKIENLGKTVWEDDTSRDGKCWLEDFDRYEIAEIYGINSTGDFGIKAEETLQEFNKYLEGLK